MKTYRTLTGRVFALTSLTPQESAFLRRIHALYQEKPPWDQFSAKWLELARTELWAAGKIPVGHPVYRIGQDLASRLGIAEGKVAPPDYRDQLVDLIEQHFGSRYAFCKHAGIDQAYLSRVLAGKQDFLPKTFSKVLQGLGVQIRLVEKHRLIEQAEATLLET